MVCSPDFIEDTYTCVRKTRRGLEQIRNLGCPVLGRDLNDTHMIFIAMDGTARDLVYSDAERRRIFAYLVPNYTETRDNDVRAIQAILASVRTTAKCFISNNMFFANISLVDILYRVKNGRVEMTLGNLESKLRPVEGDATRALEDILQNVKTQLLQRIDEDVVQETVRSFAERNFRNAETPNYPETALGGVLSRMRSMFGYS